MLRIYLKSAAAHRSEIGTMASLPRPVDVLNEEPLVALDQVEAVPPHGPSRGQGEGELAQHRRLAERGKPVHRHARSGELPGGGEEMHLISAPPGERVDHARGGRLDAAVKGEGATHQREFLHRLAITRSTSGNSARRAASKL